MITSGLSQTDLAEYGSLFHTQRQEKVVAILTSVNIPSQPFLFFLQHQAILMIECNV